MSLLSSNFPQLYDNEINPLGQEVYGVERCNSRMVEKGPIDDQRYVQGYFLIHPDLEELRPPGLYVYKALHEQPMLPPPPQPPVAAPSPSAQADNRGV